MKRNRFIVVYILSCFILISQIISLSPIDANSVEELKDDHFMVDNVMTLTENDDLYFDTGKPIVQYQTLSTGLPDLEFIELKAWWGPINTSAIGLFVRYGVINTGFELNGTSPIESNLSFYTDGNQTHFGYIIQRPLFYPTHWYPGEILGGNFYFQIDERPTSITVIIDTNESIDESNETNNKMTITVVDGISVNGEVYYNYNDQLMPIQSTVELKQCDNESLIDYFYRTFRTDEQGHFAMSIYPSGDRNVSRRYSLTATDVKTNMKSYNQTPVLLSGQETNMNFVFKGSSPEEPIKPIGRKSGGIDYSYRFLTTTNDEDADKIYYKYNWGDGTFSDWIGPFEGSMPCITSNGWENEGSYHISVIARDSTGLLSDWSESYQITLSTEKPLPPIIQLLHDILERILPDR